MKLIGVIKKASIVAIAGFMMFTSTAFFYDEPRDFEITKNMDIFFSVFKEINTFYVDEIDPGKTLKKAIDAMLKSLDPYTVFYPESKIEDFKFMTTGEYGGIGAVVQKRKDKTIVIDVYENSSAAKSGVKAGDEIIKIGNIDILNKTLDEVSDLLKGKQNTQVFLTIKRINEPKELEIAVKQEKISIPSVPYAGLLKNNVAYIRFNSFTENSAIEFGEALKKLALEAELKGIIVDLRGNPGGLLNDAVRIVNYFIPKDLLIVETKGKVKQWNAKYIAQAEPLFESTPLVVLVNRGSASASEIVSGALQDLDRAVVIGERTYGKGLVQTTRKLVYNTRIKVTTAKYYIPSGRCIQALDYSHRNIDGSVSHIPDSLITKYFTKNGRVVYDGGGILPDLIADTIEYSLNFKKMMSQGHLFDFATEFSAENVKILEAKQFFVSDSLLNSFYKYLTTQNFEFESKSNAHLASLEKELIAENRLSEFNTELDLIRSKLDESKYLLKEKDAIFIKKYLGSEIVSRYFYQRGRIQYHIRFDDAVSAALSVLADQNYYKNILNGEVGEHKIEEK